MALDTVTAALASAGGRSGGRGDQRPGGRRRRRRAAGAEVILDVPDAGLNPALAYAATLVRRTGATASLPGVVALAADLPALRTDDLTAALRAAGAGDRGSAAAFVTDAAGTGTVLLAAPPGAAARAVLRRRARRRPTRPAARSRSTATGRACAATWTPRPTSPRRSCSASARTPAHRPGRAVRESGRRARADRGAGQRGTGMTAG